MMTLAAICEHGCGVGDGIVALAIALGVVGFFWVLFRHFPWD